VKVQNTFNGQNNIARSANCKYRTTATPYTLETWPVSGTLLQIPCIKVITRISIIIIIIIITMRKVYFGSPVLYRNTDVL